MEKVEDSLGGVNFVESACHLTLIIFPPLDI